MQYTRSLLFLECVKEVHAKYFYLLIRLIKLLRLHLIRIYYKLFGLEQKMELHFDESICI